MTTIGKPTYEELEKKCALQQSKLAAINELMSVVEKASDIAKAGIEELQSQNADMAVQLANAESKCRELAAENAKKSRCLGFFASVIKSGESWTRVCQHEYNEAQETPATDAFLAEVRASGADECVRQLVISDAADDFCDAPNVCAMVAHQLRKGAAL